jgi:hypothetical protein
MQDQILSTSRPELSGSGSVAAASVAAQHVANERQWRDLLNRHFPRPRRLLRWGLHHRVYRFGDRVAKIEKTLLNEHDHTLGVEYEYSLLLALEGRACTFHPTYKVIDNRWCVLEIDFIEGEYLDELLEQGRGRELSIIRMVARLFWVSLAGVTFKQLRGRHVIRRIDGSVAFIDFGHSTRTHPLNALWQNFTPFSFSGGKASPRRLSSLILEILRPRPKSDQQDTASTEFDRLVEGAQRRWQMNGKRAVVARARYLADHYGDSVMADELEAMERCVAVAIGTKPENGVDLPEFHFAEYGFAGAHDWGFLWDALADRVDWAGKRVLELSGGLGPVGVYARLEGAAHVTSLETDGNLREASRHFAKALRITDNDYGPLGSPADARRFDSLPAADILTVLSVRLESAPLERLMPLMSRYAEVLWQTPDAEAAVAALGMAGFRTIEVLLRTTQRRYIVYAADRNTSTSMAEIS